MRNLFSILVLSILLFSCRKEEESFVIFNSSPALESYLPSFSGGQNFASSNGDTIKLYTLTSTNTIERTNQKLNSTFSDLDYVGFEKSLVIVGNDTLGFKFTFDLQTAYNPSLLRKSEDILTIYFEDQSIAVDTSMRFTYTDSLNFFGTDYVYSDTLQVQNQEFYNVFYKPRNPISNVGLYINQTYGLVGFRSTNNLIYELIP